MRAHAPFSVRTSYTKLLFCAFVHVLLIKRGAAVWDVASDHPILKILAKLARLTQNISKTACSRRPCFHAHPSLSHPVPHHKNTPAGASCASGETLMIGGSCPKILMKNSSFLLFTEVWLQMPSLLLSTHPVLFFTRSQINMFAANGWSVTHTTPLPPPHTHTHTHTSDVRATYFTCFLRAGARPN